MPRVSAKGDSLDGLCVVIARSEERAQDLSRAIEGRGAQAIVVPVVRYRYTQNRGGIADRIERRATYTHLIFTSAVAAELFFQASQEAGVHSSHWSPACIAAVGARTALAIEAAGLTPAVVSDGGGAELAAKLVEEGSISRGSRVLLPQSAIARTELREALAAAGAEVDAIALYDTVPEEPEKIAPFLEVLRQGATPDVVIFTSPSTLSAFLQLTGEAGRALLGAGAKIVTIGPTTSQAVAATGLNVAAEAYFPGVDGLVDAVVRASVF